MDIASRDLTVMVMVDCQVYDCCCCCQVVVECELYQDSTRQLRNDVPVSK